MSDNFKFCIICGQKLPMEAQFCLKCGSKAGNPDDISSEEGRLVPAKCPFCGANLKVHPENKKAVCNYCETEFMIPDAIRNYNLQTDGNVNINDSDVTINNGPSAENLKKRGDECAGREDFDAAREYYKKVLDLDPDNKEIKEKWGRYEVMRLCAEGDKLFNKCRFNAALELYLKAARIEPENREVLNRKNDLEMNIVDHAEIKPVKINGVNAKAMSLGLTKLIFYDAKDKVVGEFKTDELAGIDYVGLTFIITDSGKRYEIVLVSEKERIKTLFTVFNLYTKDMLANKYPADNLYSPSFQPYFLDYQTAGLEIYLLKNYIYIITSTQYCFYPLQGLKITYKNTVLDGVTLKFKANHKYVKESILSVYCADASSDRLSLRGLSPEEGDKFYNALLQAVNGVFPPEKGRVFRLPLYERYKTEIRLLLKEKTK